MLLTEANETPKSKCLLWILGNLVLQFLKYSHCINITGVETQTTCLSGVTLIQVLFTLASIYED